MPGDRVRGVHVAAMRARGIEALRVGYGLAVVLAPRRVQRTFGVVPDSASTRVARVLGARHVAQGILSGAEPGREVLALGVWVDTLHALSMLGLAVLAPARARAGLTDSAVAGTFAALGASDLVSGDVAGRSGLRDELARQVLRRVPAGSALLRLADARLSRRG